MKEGHALSRTSSRRPWTASSPPRRPADAFAMQGDRIDTLFASTPRSGVALPPGGPGLTPDTVVMGWNTFAVGLPFGQRSYPHLRQYVFSRPFSEEVGGDVVLRATIPSRFVPESRAVASWIWLCGGVGWRRARRRIDRPCSRSTRWSFGAIQLETGRLAGAPPRVESARSRPAFMNHYVQPEAASPLHGFTAFRRAAPGPARQRA